MLGQTIPEAHLFLNKCKPDLTLPCELLRLEDIQEAHKLRGEKDGEVAEQASPPVLP